MVNRWVEFVKNYAKEQNISYTCAMCEIKTKGLYKPLKKEAIKEEPKIFTIKTKKTNPKKEEEEKPKEDKQLKYNDVLQKLLQYLNSKSISSHTLKEVNEYINDFTNQINFSYEPIKSKLGIEKLKNIIIEELNLPENKSKFEALQKRQAEGDLYYNYQTLNKQNEEEDKILIKDPLLNNLYNAFFQEAVSMTREQKYNEIMEKIKNECSKFTYPKTNFDCEEINEEITDYFEKSLKNFIKFNFRKIIERMKNSNKKEEITEKEIENPDIISNELQRLLFVSGTEKIKNALIKLKFKGRLQTNPIMRNMQILQNFNTIEKMIELIKELKKMK